MLVLSRWEGNRQRLDFPHERRQRLVTRPFFNPFELNVAQKVPLLRQSKEASKSMVVFLQFVIHFILPSLAMIADLGEKAFKVIRLMDNEHIMITELFE